jgi:hypothetical protein
MFEKHSNYYNHLVEGLFYKEAQSKVIDECLGRMVFNPDVVNEVRISLRGQFPILDLLRSGKIDLKENFRSKYPYISSIAVDGGYGMKYYPDKLELTPDGKLLCSELKDFLGEDGFKTLAGSICLTTRLFFYHHSEDLKELTVGALDQNEYIRRCCQHRLEKLKCLHKSA